MPLPQDRHHFRTILISGLLTAWEVAGYTYGPGQQIQLQELLNKLPLDTPPSELKTYLAPLFAWNADSQEEFYKLFDQVLEQTEVQLEEHQWRVRQLRADRVKYALQQPTQLSLARISRSWQSTPTLFRLSVASAFALVLLLLVGPQIYSHLIATPPPAEVSIAGSEIFVPIRLDDGTLKLNFQPKHLNPQRQTLTKVKWISDDPEHVKVSTQLRRENLDIYLKGLSPGRETIAYEVCYESGTCSPLQLIIRVDEFPKYQPPLQIIRSDLIVTAKNLDPESNRNWGQIRPEWSEDAVLSSNLPENMDDRPKQLKGVLSGLDATERVEGVTTRLRFGGGFADFTLGKGLFVAACALLLWFLGWWIRRRQQRFSLDHQAGNHTPYAWTIRIPALNDIDLGVVFKKTLTAMRRRDQLLSQHIDVGRTVEATVRKGGAIAVRYTEQTQSQPFLVLIDKAGQNNHMAKILDLFFRQLQANDAPIERFFFDKDPMYCRRDKENRQISLQSLQHTYQNYHLVVCSRGHSLLDDKGRLNPLYQRTFSGWRRRVLLTLQPISLWGSREIHLGHTFRLLPATPSGIAELVDTLEAIEPKDYRETLEGQNHSGSQQAIKIDPGFDAPTLIRALQAEYVDYRLGQADDTLLRWIAACAIPPAIFWDWTRFVGQWLSSPEDNYLTLDNLLRIARLSWFEDGKMPDDVRNALLDWLEANYPAWLLSMRQKWDHILQLEENLPPVGSMTWAGHRLEIIVNELLQDTDWRRRRQLELELEQLIHGSEERDAMVLRYLEKRAGALDAQWNSRLRPLVKKQGEITWTWRSWVWQAPVLLLIFLGSLFVNYGLPVTVFQFDDYISELSFSPDNKSIVVANGSGKVAICSIDGNWLRGVEEERAKIVGLAMTDDAQTILTGTNEQDLAFWDVSGVPVYYSEVTSPKLVNDLAFHPLDAYQILCGNYDKTAEIWDLQNNQLVHSFPHPDAVLAAVFSPDGRTILTGCRDGKGRIWDMEGSSPVELGEHQGPIQAVAVSPDGQYFLTGSRDKTVKLWSRNGRLIRTFSGHTAGLLSVAFSTDGQRIVTGGADDRALLWSVSDGRILQRFRGHRNYVSAVAFSRDGKKVLTGDREGKVKLWRLQ